MEMVSAFRDNTILIEFDILYTNRADDWVHDFFLAKRWIFEINFFENGKRFRRFLLFCNIFKINA